MILGVVAARTLPRRYRAVAAVTFLVWGTLTITVANVLVGVGGKPDMDSLLNRPYVTAWLVLTALLLGGAMVTTFFRSRQDQPGQPRRPVVQ